LVLFVTFEGAVVLSVTLAAVALLTFCAGIVSLASATVSFCFITVPFVLFSTGSVTFASAIGSGWVAFVSFLLIDSFAGTVSFLFV
jgi:hypothetical protein